MDVGGQRSERRKWLKCFDGVVAVLFIVGISEYDQTLLEDPEVNRMQESLKVFGVVCNIEWFLSSSLLLFLNKKDVFDEKIEYSSIKQCFPDYPGSARSYEASYFIQQQFRKQNKKERQIYCHYTNAKNKQNIKVVFDVIVDTIMSTNVKDGNFLV